MLKEFVSVGKWWLPNNPELVVTGKIVFSPDTGAALELIGSFYSSHFEKTGHKEELDLPIDFFPELEGYSTSGERVDLIKPQELIILGLLDNNEEVTLYRCFGKVKSLNFSKDRTILFFDIEYVFRGIHFEDESSIKLKSISARYSHLNDWIDRPGIKVSFSEEQNKISMSYQPPFNIHLTRIDDLVVDITFSQINGYFEEAYYSASIKQQCYLTIQNPCHRSVDECVDLLIIFRDFLSFAITRPSSVIEVVAKSEVIHKKPLLHANRDITLEDELREIQVTVLFGLWNSNNNSEPKLHSCEMLFLLGDIENNLGAVFEAWINKREMYESVFELLMITMYTSELYLHYKFVNIIQVLEAYHTIKYDSLYQDKKVYETGVYNKLREVLNEFPSDSDEPESGISDEFRRALKGKLKSQNKFTLETRIKEIIKDLHCLLPNDFIGSIEDRELFSRRASETRNALTHHDRKKKEKAAKDLELFQLYKTLTTILQACLLRELNLTDESIQELLERNYSQGKRI